MLTVYTASESDRPRTRHAGPYRYGLTSRLDTIIESTLDQCSDPDITLVPSLGYTQIGSVVLNCWREQNVGGLVEQFRQIYNTTHLHSRVGYRTPAEVRRDSETKEDSPLSQEARQQTDPVPVPMA